MNSSRTDVSIEHIDLDPPDDDDGDDPTTGIFVSIYAADGMRYVANTSCDGDPTIDELAEMVAKTVTGAVSAHSNELRAALVVARTARPPAASP